MHTLKSRHSQNESLFGADFCPHNSGIIGPFFYETKQGVTGTVNHYWAMLNEFLCTKFEEQATFGFNRAVLRTKQPKLHSKLCALFLKITLSATETSTIFLKPLVKYNKIGPIV